MNCVNLIELRSDIALFSATNMVSFDGISESFVNEKGSTKSRQKGSLRMGIS
jgi:hypothetical protein